MRVDVWSPTMRNFREEYGEWALITGRMVKKLNQPC